MGFQNTYGHIVFAYELTAICVEDLGIHTTSIRRFASAM